MTRGKKKDFPIATSPTSKLTWIGQGLNPVLRCQTPTNKPPEAWYGLFTD